MSGKKPFIPAFVLVCSWDGGVLAGCSVDMARGFVMALLAVVLVGNALSVGGAESELDPLAIECRLELCDAVVDSFFLFGGDGGVGGAGAAATAAAVV